MLPIRSAPEGVWGLAPGAHQNIQKPGTLWTVWYLDSGSRARGGALGIKAAVRWICGRR